MYLYNMIIIWDSIWALRLRVFPLPSDPSKAVFYLIIWHVTFYFFPSRVTGRARQHFGENKNWRAVRRTMRNIYHVYKKRTKEYTYREKSPVSHLFVTLSLRALHLELAFRGVKGLSHVNSCA